MNENTLEKNKINQFILRIDLPKDSPVDFRKLALDLQGEYVRLIENVEHNVNINFNTDEVTKRDFTNYTLVADNGIKLIMNTVGKTISIETTSYIDNSVYDDRLDSIINKINAQGIPNVMAARIGMRYINLFPCDRKESIKKILQKPNDKAIIDSLSKQNLNRSVFVEQFNCEGYYIRVQYGVVNKFYPAVISNLDITLDITLDIDVYYGGLQSIENWKEVIRTYNHAAFVKFKEYVEPDFINSMRNE